MKITQPNVNKTALIKEKQSEKAGEQPASSAEKGAEKYNQFLECLTGQNISKKVKITSTILAITLLLLIGFAGFVLGNWYRPKLMFSLRKGGVISAGDTFKTVLKKTGKAFILAPVYWVQSNLGNNGLDDIYLDVKFKHMTKLNNKRDEAIARGQLIQGDDDYVPGNIRHGKETIPVKLRLKGDWTDHLKGHKWSFRIKTKGKNQLFGMRVFSFQAPWTRGYQAESLFMSHLRREGIIAPRYQFVHLHLNGKDLGVMALEEHFSKELLENQGRKESVIIRFDESLLWQSLDKNGSQSIYANYAAADIKTFQSGKVEKSPVLSQYLKNATGLLRGYVQGTLTADQVFDTEQMGKFLGVSEVWDAGHQLAWTNLRFYYNPLTAKLEPVAYDVSANFPSEFQGLMVPQHTKLMSQLLENKSIRTAYIQTVNRVGQAMADGSLIETIKQEEVPILKGLRTEFPMLQPFDFTRLKNRAKGLTKLTEERYPSYKGYAFSASDLNYPKLANGYWIKNNNQTYLALNNIIDEPVEVVKIRWKDTEGHWYDLTIDEAKKIIPPTAFDTPPAEFRFNNLPGELKNQAEPSVEYTVKLANKPEAALEKHAFKPYVEASSAEVLPRSELKELLTQHTYLSIDQTENTAKIKSGTWSVNRSIYLPQGMSLEIPAGTTLRFAQNARIFARGSINVLGTKERPVILSNQFGAPYWQGVVVMGALNPSSWSYVTVQNTKGHTLPNWSLTGSTTFYKSNVALNHVTFKNNLAEDALNIVHSEFEMNDVIIQDTVSDAFDSDFSKGIVTGGLYRNIGGDGIDVSGTKLTVQNVQLEKIHDKAISIGEASDAIVSNIVVTDSGTGVASKDASNIEIKNSGFENIHHVGMMAYVKKPEYGPASITASGNNIMGSPKDYLAQTGSEVSVDGKALKAKDIDVDKLYKEGYMKK